MAGTRQLREALLGDGRPAEVAADALRMFEPLDLIARLCAMVPPPRFHMIRYHGVLSSHAKLRSEVVPEPPADAPAPPPRHLDLYQDNDEIHLVRKPWAWLVRHVFAADVAVCPKCDGPMRWVEVATEPDDIARLLAHHDLGPPPAPRPRGPPSGQLAFAFANGT